MPGKKAFGTQLKAEVTTPGTFVAIANITNIDPFNITVDIVDASSHDSPGEAKEKLSGMKDNGPCSFDINYDNSDTGHQFLQNNSGATKNFKVVFPGVATPNTAAFSAIIKSFAPKAPHDGKLQASCALEITSVITWT